MATPRLPVALDAKAKQGPGRYNVAKLFKGAPKGLYLHVRDNGSRCWVFRYRDAIASKQRDMGLGCMPEVSLELAIERALEARRSARGGGSPLTEREAAKMALRLAAARAKSFGDCADAYIESRKAGWQNAKHADQWANTLTTYAGTLRPLPVQAIDTDLVISALEPIWTTKTETATRVRQRIEAVLDWATARKYRTGENPARWRGHLEKLLPPPAKVRRVKHMAALPYADMPAYMAELAQKDTLGSKALRLQILCALRPGEAVGARADEFDLHDNVWTVPAARMKAKREHRVPLSKEAAALVRERIAAGAPGGLLFPGVKHRPITTAATLAVAQELRPGLTAHGFRSTFRDWAGDLTSFPREVAEMALAHTIKDKTEAVYRRKDALERRRRLMQEWATYCETPKATGDNVTPIGRASGKAG